MWIYIMKLRHLTDDELGIESQRDVQYPYTTPIESCETISTMSCNMATEATNECEAAIAQINKQLSEPESFKS